jgi:DNA-directed RNA polymerase specialized sigma subunit
MSVKEKELELWKEWKYKGNQQALSDLMASLRPLIKKISSPWIRSGIPQSALEGEVKRIVVESLNNYDPSFGVQLNTFIISRSKKINRYVYKHQNIGRISEQRITQIGTFNNVKQFLTDRYSREPSSAQLADELGWSVPEVERMEKESRRDIIGSMQIVEPGMIMTDRDQEVLDFLYYELTPEEQVIYEYLLGKHGKPMLKANEIAKRLGTNPAKISRVRAKMAEKYRAYV